MNIRNRWRRTLLLWSVLPAAGLLLAAAKLLSLGPLAGQAAESFSRKEAPALAASAQWLGLANVIEPHKSRFAEGDARVLDGDFAAARLAFEAALAAAPADDECTVRVNLVLSIEQLGDAADRRGKHGDAAASYSDALAMAEESPGSCFGDGTPGRGNGEGRRLDEAAARLRDKVAAAQGAAAPAEPRQTPPSEPAAETKAEQDRLVRLEDEGRAARQDRAQGQGLDRYLDGDMHAVDRPWYGRLRSSAVGEQCSAGRRNAA